MQDLKPVLGKTLFVFIVISAVYGFAQVMDALGIDRTLLQFVLLGVFLVLVILNAGKQL